jgi:hypothetical protein
MFGGPSSGTIDEQGAVRPVGGAWEPLASPGLYWNFENRLAVGPDGTALVVSQCTYCDDEAGTYAAARAIGPGGIGDKQLLSDTGEGAEAPHAGVDGSGRATVVWSSSLGIRVAARGAGGAWSSATTIDAGSGPTLAVNGSGIAEAAWIASDGSLVSARRTGPDGVWGSPAPMAAASAAPSNWSWQDDPVELAIDGGGKAVATWTGPDGRVRAGVRPAGAGWTVTTISGAGAAEPHVAVNPAGTAFVTFLGPTGAVLVSSRPAGGTWSVPEPLSAAGSTRPLVAVDASGDAVAAWISAGGALQTSTFDATEPVLGHVSVPGAAVVGQRMTATMSAPWDLWSPVGTVGWDFGDGATGSGPSAAHAYAAPGTYAVTARAVDAEGNVTTTTREVSVAAAPVTTPVTTPVRTPAPTGTVGAPSSGPLRASGPGGSVGGVTISLPGAAAGSTPAPVAKGAAARRAMPRLRVAVTLPKRVRAHRQAIVGVSLSRSVHGALARVQLRRGVGYATVA